MPGRLRSVMQARGPAELPAPFVDIASTRGMVGGYMTCVKINGVQCVRDFDFVLSYIILRSSNRLSRIVYPQGGRLMPWT